MIQLYYLAGFGTFISNQMGIINEDEQEFIEHDPEDIKKNKMYFMITLEALGAKDFYEDEETINGFMDEIT